ncbi:MAG: hypothetical protein R6X12_01700, partial [bacterium]
MSIRVLTALVVSAGLGLASAGWLSVGGGAGGPEINIVEQSDSRTTFEVVVPGVVVEPVVTEAGGFVRLGLPGEVFAVLGEGRPEVPKVSVLLGVPLGARVTARAVV